MGFASIYPFIYFHFSFVQWTSNRTVVLVYRLFMFLYMLSWIIYNLVVLYYKIVFVYFFTNWQVISITAYFFVAVLVSVQGICTRSDRGDLSLLFSTVLSRPAVTRVK